MPEPSSRYAVGLPTAALRVFVSHYAGFCGRDLTLGTHAGLPSRHVHLIISFGAPIEILQMPNSNQRAGRFTAFVCGLQDAPALVRRDGSVELLHVFLEPVGTRVLLGVSGSELASRVFALPDLWGRRRSAELVERLSDAPSWQRRFDVLDDIFTRTLTPMNRFRISLAALFCAVGFAASSVAGAQANDKADVEKELKKFQGTWTLQSSITGGTEIPADQLKGLIVTFEGDTHTLKQGDEVIQVGTQKLDPSKSPKTIDMTLTEGPNKGAVMLGIYEIDEDTLKACFDPQGKKRPTEFKSAPGSANFVNIHKRLKK